VSNTQIWFVLLCTSIVYHIVVWEYVGNLKNRMHIHGMQWIVLRYSGLLLVSFATVGNFVAILLSR
jgi:hypothetical protein